jgi:hypothetical protein
MFIDKLEESMNESIEGLKRRGLARGLNIILGVLIFLIVAAGVIRVLGVSISALTEYDDGWELDVPVAIGEGSFYTRLWFEIVEDTASAFISKGISQARGRLILHHYNLPLHSSRQAGHLLVYAALLWGITLLRRILATTAAGYPFDPLNPSRLNMLGWIILCWSAVASLQKYLMSKWILSRLEPVTVPLAPAIDIHLEWLMCGLLVLVLAAIWKEAVLTADEQSLTV